MVVDSGEEVEDEAEPGAASGDLSLSRRAHVQHLKMTTTSTTRGTRYM